MTNKTKANKPKKQVNNNQQQKKKKGSKNTLKVTNSVPSVNLAALAGRLAQRGANMVIPGLGDIGAALIKGSGDYKISSNTLHNGQVPSFATLDQPYRFRYREFLGTVGTATSYTVQQSLNLNPGLLAPILTQISESFTMYKFHGLVFTFNSTSANAVSSTNTALGVMGMVSNYDPSQPVYPNRVQAEEAVGCVSAVPSANLYHPVECKPKTTLFEKRWVRFSSEDFTHPIGETDLGLFQLFADGAQAASVAGELWVAYDVEFFLPRISPIGTGDAQLLASQNIAVTTNPYSLEYSNETHGTLFTISQANSSIILSEPGYYRVHMSVNCSAATAHLWTTPVVTGGSLYTALMNVGYNYNSATGTDFLQTIAVDLEITVAGGYVQFGGAGYSCNIEGVFIDVIVLSPFGLSNTMLLERNMKSMYHELVIMKAQLQQQLGKMIQTDSEFEEMPKLVSHQPTVLPGKPLPEEWTECDI